MPDRGAKAGTGYVEIDAEMGRLKRRIAAEMPAISQKAGKDFSRNFERGVDTRSVDRSLGRTRHRTEGLHDSLLRLKIVAGALAFGPAVSGMSAASAGAVALTGSLGPLLGTLGAVPGLASAAGQALATIKLGTAGVGDAVKAAMAEQAKGSADATAAHAAQAAAAERVRGAEQSLADAQRQRDQVQRALIATTAAARREYEDLRQAAEDGATSQKTSAKALQDAIDQLANLRVGGTASASDITDAELRVEQARNDLKNTRRETKRAREDFKAAQKTTVNGMPAVVAANESVADANRGVARAQHDLVTATEASTAAMGKQGAAATAYDQALAKLSPRARKFVKTLLSYKPALKDLQATSANGLFPGVEVGLASAMKNLPVVKQLVAGTSRELGGIAAKTGKFLARADVGRDIASQAKANDITIRRFGQGSLNLADALRHVTHEAQPLTEWITRMALGWTKNIDRQAKAGRESGKTAAYFEHTREILERLISITGHVKDGLKGIFRAGRDDGDDLWLSIDRVATRFDHWANSLRGQKTLRDWFASGRDTIHDVGDAIGAMSARFHELRRGGKSSFDALAITMSEAFARALSNSAETIAKRAPGLAVAFVKGFLAADTWGRIAIGGWLIAKFGGLGAIRGVGALAGGQFAKGFATTAGAGMAAATHTAALQMIHGGEARSGMPVSQLGAQQGRLRSGITGLFRTVAPFAKTAGLTALGFAAMDGVADAFSDRNKALSVQGKIGSFLSKVTFGAVPDARKFAEQAVGNALSQIGSGGDLFNLPKQKVSLFGIDALGKDQTGLNLVGEGIKAQLAKIQTAFQNFKTSGVGFDALRAQISRFGAANPQFAAAVQALLAQVGKLKRGFDTSFAPQKLALNFAAAILRDNPNVKVAVATMLRDLERLPVGARAKAGRAGLAMVDELQKKGVLSAAAAKTARQGIEAELDKLAKNAKTKSARAAGNAAAGMAALITAMQIGIITSTQQVDQALGALGFKPLHLAPKLKPISKVPKTGATGSPNARGGLHQFGTPGASGRDTIPAQIGRQKVAVGSGEVAAVFNKHQLPIVNSRLSDLGGLPGLFQKVNRPHYAARGGRFSNGVSGKRFAMGGFPAMMAAANRVEKAHFPYHWGGGHEASPAPFEPFDCSGVVSYVLQQGGVKIPTMVSGDLASAGKPGPGKVTVFADAAHTWMKLGGRAFGTSLSNPGGGAGWFDPAPGYAQLPRWSVRHFDAKGDGSGDVTFRLPQLSGAPGGIQELGNNLLTKWRGGAQRGLDKLTQQGSGGGDKAEPGGWIRTGATIDPFQPGNPSNAKQSAFNGMSFAELLVAGRNAGMHPNLSELLGIHQGAFGMPFGTKIGIRKPGGNRQFDIRKSDNGSGQPGNPHFTVDLHDGIAQALHWGGNEDVEVKRLFKGGLIGKLKGMAGGGLPGQLSSTLNTIQKNKKSKVRSKKLAKLLKTIKGVGLDKKMEASLKKYTKDADLAGEYASRASQVTGTADTPAAVNGLTEAGWLQKQLDALFQLRNQLIRAYEQILAKRERLAALVATAKKRMADLSGPKGLIAKTKDKGQKKALTRVRDSIRDKILPGLKGQRTGLNTRKTELLSTLTEVQGIGSPMKVLGSLPEIGVLGGQILPIQTSLRALGEKTNIADKTTDDSNLKQLLKEANQRTAVSERQFEVFKNMPPFGGQFATGGTVPGPIGAPRTVIAHGGETIKPPGEGEGASRFRVVVEDHRVRVFENDVEIAVEKVTRKMASRGGRVMAGRAGSLSG